MRGNPSRVLQAMDEFAYQQDILINIGSDKGRIVTNLLVEKKTKVIVELGGYVGYSAILCADTMRKVRPDGPDSHVWSLEFEPRFANIAKELIALVGLEELVTVVTGPADESMRKLKTQGKLDRIDFLFLDHIEDLYEQDLKVAMYELKLLGRGACILADNVLLPGAPEYRKYVRDHMGLSSKGLKGLILPGEAEVRLLLKNKKR